MADARWLYTWDDDRPAPSTSTPETTYDDAQPLVMLPRAPHVKRRQEVCIHCGLETQAYGRECYRVTCLAMRGVDVKAARAHAQAARVMR